MLVLVFFVAILNLAVGYALGAGLELSSLLDRLPKRAKKAEAGDLEDDEQLTRPAPVEPPVAEPTPAPPPQAAAKNNPADLMASLSSLRENLSAAGVELKENKADAEQFSDSATKFQEVNHAYLEKAEGAIQQLEEMGAAGDAVAGATSRAVAEGAEQVAQLSGKLDGLIEAGLSDQASRDKLIETSEQLVQSAASTEDSAQQALGSAEATAAGPQDQQAAMAPRPKQAADSFDELFDQLEALFAQAEPEATQHVAAIRVDPIADHANDIVLTESIEKEVIGLSKGLLEGSQPFVAGRPAMALLDGDDFESAADRLERIRQQVAATTFRSNGQQVNATVTCAVVDAYADDPREKIIEQLNLALDEAGRQGSNKTFHHDGAFPTPVAERPVQVEPKTVDV